MVTGLYYPPPSQVVAASAASAAGTAQLFTHLPLLPLLLALPPPPTPPTSPALYASIPLASYTASRIFIVNEYIHI